MKQTSLNIGSSETEMYSIHMWNSLTYKEGLMPLFCSSRAHFVYTSSRESCNILESYPFIAFQHQTELTQVSSRDPTNNCLVISDHQLLAKSVLAALVKNGNFILLFNYFGTAG